jgi:hypothetical protein
MTKLFPTGLKRGSKVVGNLRKKKHEVIAAAPSTGVNTITGAGLKESMGGAQAVIDLANSPSFEAKAVLEFFETSERNLLPAIKPIPSITTIFTTLPLMMVSR